MCFHCCVLWYSAEVFLANISCFLSLVLCRLATKVTIAGGAVYVAWDSGLLGNSEQGSEALEKAKAAVPPALEEWMKYFGLEVEIMKLYCQL